MALPSGYSQLRYIQSSGTQYIDTGFKPNQNTRMVLEAASTEGKSDNNVYLFGCDAGFGTYGFSVSTWTAGFGSATSITDFDWSDGENHTIDFNCGTLTIDGTVKWTATATFQSAYNAYVMSLNRSGDTVMPFTGKLFSCKTYDNGTLVRDFVPAKDSSGAVGLYDLVNNTFYANAGTGSFTAGPLVTGPVDGVGVCIINAASFAIKEGKAMLNGAAKKITEGMTKVNGAVKKIALSAGIDVAALAITYSGAYTDQKDVVMSGKTYRLLTLTGSGTLTIPEEVTADVWMVGGGSKGNDNYDKGNSSYCGVGGAGGYSLFEKNIKVDKSVVVTVGAQNGASSFGSYQTQVVYISVTGAGGTGGGKGRSVNNNSKYTGTGDGKSKYPFEDTTAFTKPHSGGGGGGASKTSMFKYNGYDGGTNGGNAPGTLNGQNSNFGTNGGLGGDYGGGAGGAVDSYAGKNATYYGGGGGGAGYVYNGSAYRNGGAGYQGVVYVRIPYEQ